jgi:predicted dehydrogenase/threonine dehydrogenase-like Zn-dependent dehydrogenase
MRQIARRLKDGRLELVEVAEPAARRGSVSVRVEASAISSGTERATLDVARKSLVAKARARPEQARAVIDRARSDGVRSTIALVRQRLEELGPLGYSAAGVVVEVGEGVRDLAPGDRVAIAGGGAANHAEIDVVPALLCARVPDGVALEDAAFAALGAIALNGYRRGGAEVGSTVAVVGLGLVGQLAVRVARAAGCSVIGTDLNGGLVELAKQVGADAVPRSELVAGSRWEGTADSVLICAASQSNDPVELAARLARDRAPVVIVGDVGIDVPRAPFYDKELDLRLARSYGPGRYDPAYEEHGIDYPIGYVRWTQQRNMTAFLELVAAGKISPAQLVSQRFDLSEAERAFDALDSRDAVGALLLYHRAGEGASTSSVPTAESGNRTDGSATEQTARGGPRGARVGRPTPQPGFAVLGAGAFATSTIIPGLKSTGLRSIAIASASGLSAEGARRKFGFELSSSNADEVINDDRVDLVAIATRHNTHADLAARSLAAGKATYVEKPLALDEEGLQTVLEAQRASGAPLFVGFNRRYAPLAVEIATLAGPRLMGFRVNAGRLAPGHWTNDPRSGGGRLKGEGCHFIDFLCWQAASDPISVLARGFPSDESLPLVATDNFTVQLAFADGSAGTLSYAADAPTGPGKERFETSAPGCFAEIDDFRSGAIWTGHRRRRLGGRRRDKGHSAQFAAIAAVARGEADPPEAEAAVVSTLATLAAARSLGTGTTEPIVMAPETR